MLLSLLQQGPQLHTKGWDQGCSLPGGLETSCLSCPNCRSCLRMCRCHLGRNRNCSSKENQRVLGRDGHNGRERKTETGRASHAKPSGEERCGAPRQKKEKEGIEQRKQKGRKGPPKSQECAQKVQAQLLHPAPSKTNRNNLGQGRVGGASRDTGTGSSSVTNSRQMTTLFASGFAPGEARGLDDDL